MAKPKAVSGRIITSARLISAVISILLVKAVGFVVSVACGIGHDLIGCHLCQLDAWAGIAVTNEVVGIVFTSIPAVGLTAIVWSTVSFIVESSVDCFFDHLCSLLRCMYYNRILIPCQPLGLIGNWVNDLFAAKVEDPAVAQHPCGAS